LALFTYRLTYFVPHFGMRTYKKVGADPTLLESYQVYQRFCTLLKLDWLFQLQSLSFSLIGLVELTWQWWASVAVQLPITLMWLPLGLLSVRREHAALMVFFLLAAALQPPLYVAQILSIPAPNATDVLTNHTRNESMYCTQTLREDTYPFGSTTLNVLYSLTLATRLLLLSSALLVRRNFGKGLATRVHNRSRSLLSSASEDGSRSSGSRGSGGVGHADAERGDRQPPALGHTTSLISPIDDGGAYVAADALAAHNAPHLSRDVSVESQSSCGLRVGQRLTIGSAASACTGQTTWASLGGSGVFSSFPSFAPTAAEPRCVPR
jgi:hypothetical protein